MNSTHAQLTKINEKLRRIRQEKRWTLDDVEEQSQGQIKAVVLGSYERGVRQMNVKKLLEISHFYNVPVHYFLEEKEFQPDIPKKITFDLRKLSQESKSDLTIRRIEQFLHYLGTIRKDWNGEMITPRREDCSILSILLEIDLDELTDDHQLLFGKLKR